VTIVLLDRSSTGMHAFGRDQQQNNFLQL